VKQKRECAKRNNSKLPNVLIDLRIIYIITIFVGKTHEKNRLREGIIV